MKYLVFILLSLLLACKPANTQQTSPNLPVERTIDSLSSAVVETIVSVSIDTLDYDSTQWTELVRLDSSIVLDIRYATEDNFVGKIMYACPRCFLRPEAAQAVVAAQAELSKEGLGLKMFDCYRPRDVQWKLWEIMPQPGFVADPRKGSIHNRGGAVDLTIIDADGEQLDMGTTFDFFGPEANHNYTELPEAVLANRRKLKELLGKHGFSPIRSEWWHYNFRGKRYELADEEWKCKVE